MTRKTQRSSSKMETGRPSYNFTENVSNLHDRKVQRENTKKNTVAVSCGFSTCFANSACDGLCYLTKDMDRVGTPFGFQSIMSTFVRHTVSRCLIFLAPKVTWSDLDFLQFLPTGVHGLCFGYCFSGPIPLRSLINDPPIGVRFRESLVIRLHSEIDQIHLSIEAQGVTTLLPLGDCHSFYVFLFSLYTYSTVVYLYMYIC